MLDLQAEPCLGGREAQVSLYLLGQNREQQAEEQEGLDQLEDEELQAGGIWGKSLFYHLKEGLEWGWNGEMQNPAAPPTTPPKPSAEMIK